MADLISVLVEAGEPVLTLDQAKLAAGLDWVSPDPRDAQMNGFVAAATSYIEKQLALALMEQTRDVFAYGDLPEELVLPTLCKPLRDVESITYTDVDGAAATVDPETYVFDEWSGRIVLVGDAWPTNYDAFARWTIRIVAGWSDPALLPADLFQAVSLLTAHFATSGRDLATSGTIITETPLGFDDLIAPYRPVVCS